MTDKKFLWQEAGLAGLALGFVPIAYMGCSYLVGLLGPGFLNTLLGLILWTAKFVGCIWLLRHFMQRYVDAEPQADNSDSFKFGTATALLSALVYSTFYLADILFIQPDMFQQAFDAAIQASSGMLDSNSLAALDELMPKLPTITFFVNLIYCFLFGMVASAILSRNIPETNPFAGDKNDDIEE